MKYFLQRDGRTYGPYSFEDLKRYQTENRIGPNDTIRKEDSQQWEPWQQVLNAPTPPAAPTFTPPPAAPQAGGFGSSQQGFGAPPSSFGGGSPSPFGQSQPQSPYSPPQPFGQPQGGFSSQPSYTPQQPEQGFGGGFGTPAGGFGGGFGGNQPVAQDPYGGGYGNPAYGQPGAGGYGAGTPGPMPPDMQWWMVLLISILCGFFAIYWIFKQAGFVKKLDPQSNATKMLAIGFSLMLGAYVFVLISMGLAAATDTPSLGMLGMLAPLFYIGAFVCVIMAVFGMRKSIHDYYNNVEPMGINLMDTAGALLTFFFPVYFFQHHFYNIAMRKKSLGHQ